MEQRSLGEICLWGFGGWRRGGACEMCHFLIPVLHTYFFCACFSLRKPAAWSSGRPDFSLFLCLVNVW